MRTTRRVIPAALLTLVLVLLPSTLLAADKAASDASEVLFLGQIIALFVCGRLMGEVMQRIGQPAVMGQLIAGVLLGPSVLGQIWPDLQHHLFPSNPAQKAMLDAVAQLGILLMLLLTGMETDLSIFRRSRRAAFSVSLCGIAVPFLCGVTIGELLPESMLPDPGKRLITMLFLGTALSISSVKIVAMVVRQVGFLRRNVGQIMVAAAIIDDTIGWIIMSVTFGLAAHGTVEISALAQSIIGTLLFLVFSFTLGRRFVFWVIRWVNDTFMSEVPVITAILAVTGVLALTTYAIGVHTVLGAFVGGILVGQSPLLTRHIDEQLRGLITALFMPVFFGLAGLTTNLTVLAETSLLLLTFTLIAIASLGKFGGAMIGGRIGGLGWAESLALGCGMNARGSTEVIVATMGLAMGVLTPNLFTAIVAMAVVTTMSMPPLLRWALARLPLSAEEAARLEREEFEAQGFIPKIERLLVAVDASPTGQFASRLIGLLAGARRIPTTVILFDYEGADSADESSRRQIALTRAVVQEGAATGDEAGVAEGGVAVPIATRSEKPESEVIATEASKGYGLLFIGREPASEGAAFHKQITQSAAEFSGPFAIAIARGIDRHDARGTPLNILVPVTGTAVSRQGAEVAIALAQAAGGSLTALHVARSRPDRSPRSLSNQLGAALAAPSSAEATIREIVRLGDPYGVNVKGALRGGEAADEAILRQIAIAGHNLVVMGVDPRPGDRLFFGEVAGETLARAPCSLLFVSSEPFAFETPQTEDDDGATSVPARAEAGLQS